MTDPKDEIPATELSASDARVLDFLAEHGFDASRIAELPAEDRPRALAIIRQMDVLERYPVDPPHESVVDATLARIDRFEAERAASMRIGGRWRPRVRLSDVVGVAALLLVATGVALPMISQVRAQSLSTVCANNLRALGAGLANYANEHGGSMPAMAGIGGGLFGSDQPTPQGMPSAVRGNGQPPAVQAAERAALARALNAVHGGVTVTIVPNWGSFQHSANLALLVSKGYCDVHALRCPGCAAGAACFAYRVPAQGARFQLDTPHRIVVVSDANPVIELRRNGHQVDQSILSSRNHNESGQNLLFSDASVEWRTSPILNGGAPTGIDNIWLPRGEDGREHADLKVRPKDPTDTFVAQ
jgi:hypothetical protein